MFKVFKGFVEYFDMLLGDFFEGIVFYVFEGKGVFEGCIFDVVSDFKLIYGMDYGSEMVYNMEED